MLGVVEQCVNSSDGARLLLLARRLLLLLLPRRLRLLLLLPRLLLPRLLLPRQLELQQKKQLLLRPLELQLRKQLVLQQSNAHSRASGSNRSGCMSRAACRRLRPSRWACWAMALALLYPIAGVRAVTSIRLCST